MKNSEKLFKAINDIDEKIISDAKPEEQKPEQIKIKKHLPVKEIALFAACFAVLAGVVFGIVKYRIDHPIVQVPENSDSSDIISNSSNSQTELVFTEEDLEFQAILKELVSNAEEIDRMFDVREAVGDEYTFSFTSSYNGLDNKRQYYLIPEDARTANGLFTVPQSRDKMEDLVSRYFSKWAVDFYMENVSLGKMTTNEYGRYHIDGVSSNFLEIDGRMYLSPSRSAEYAGLGINPETAKVMHKSDTLIKFIYWDGDISDIDSDEYYHNYGTIVRENGEWKLHYFYGYGFVSDIPAEYTEEDIELQQTLEALKDGDKVMYLFTPDITNIGAVYNFVFENGEEAAYLNIMGNDQHIDFPMTISEFISRLQQYFSLETVNRYLRKVRYGTMEERPDGKYSVTLGGEGEAIPTYLQINGGINNGMYYHSGAGGFGETNYYNTATVTEKTDDTVIYSYAQASHGYITRVTGKLVYEDGSWKRDELYDPVKDSNELNSVLDALIPKATELSGMFWNMSLDGNSLTFNMGGDPDDTSQYYLIPEGRYTAPNGLFEIPQTYAEMKALLGECFSAHGVAAYMEEVSKGTLTQKSDGTYDFIPDSGYEVYEPLFIEANGTMYRHVFMTDNEHFGYGLDSAELTSKTDDTMEFKYLGLNRYTGENVSANGVLIKENGEWKLHCNKYTEFMPVFTEEDLELQKILKELAPGDEVFQWIFNGGWGDTEYNFFFGEDQQNSNVYYPLPAGRSHYYDRLENPQSYEEVTELLNRYFTKASVEGFMSYVGKGAMTERADGSYLVTLDGYSGTTMPSLIEIDGKMYIAQILRGGVAAPEFGAAKITGKTDNSITFSCNGSMGLIKREENGWRLNYAYRGMTDQDLG